MGLFNFFSASEPPPSLEERFKNAFSKHNISDSVNNNNDHDSSLKKLATLQTDILAVLEDDEELLLITPSHSIQNSGFGIVTNKRVMRFNNTLERQLPIEDIADLDFMVHNSWFPAIRIISNSEENSFLLTMPINEMCQEFMANIGRLKSKRTKRPSADEDQNDPILATIKQKIDSFLNSNLPQVLSQEESQANERESSNRFVELAEASGSALRINASETLAKARIYSKERLIEMGFPKSRQQSLGELIAFALAPWKEIYNIDKEKTLEEIIGDVCSAFDHPLRAPKFTREDRQLLYDKLVNAAIAVQKSGDKETLLKAQTNILNRDTTGLNIWSIKPETQNLVLAVLEGKKRSL